ncbi:MAG: hypothetical protein ACE5KX_06855, partial [Acidimicrobiia bacterium]
LVGALLATPMILLAVALLFELEVSIGRHRDPPRPRVVIVSPPERNEDGSLTRRGEAERRSDVVWGVGLFLGGSALAVWSVKELVAAKRVIVADEYGLRLRLGGPNVPATEFPWSLLVEARSRVIEDEAGESRVLALRFSDTAGIPKKPWGARLEGSWLYLFADDWERQAHEVAQQLQGFIIRFGTRLRSE